MKKLIRHILGAILILGAPYIAHADTLTSRLGLTLPTIGSPTWGQKISTNFQILDATSTVVSGSLLVATGTASGTFTAAASSQTADLLFEQSQFQASLAAGSTVYIKVLALPSVTTIGVSSLTVTTNVLFSTVPISVSASTLTWSNGSLESGALNNTSTVTYQAGEISGAVNNNSTTTFIGGEISGTVNNNSTTTLIGAFYSGTKTDNSTTTITGSVLIRSTVTMTSTLEIGSNNAPQVGPLEVRKDQAATTDLRVDNENTSSNTANARLTTIVGGTGSGDPYIALGVGGPVVNYSIGIDNAGNSQTQTLKISGGTSASAIPGTLDRVLISTNGVQIQGTTTNDNARTGDYGEFLSSGDFTGTSKVPPSTQFFNIVALTLTAGDWDLSGAAEISINGATITRFGVCVGGTVSGNDSTGCATGDTFFETDPLTGLTADTVTIPTVRKTVAFGSSTTFYLKGFSTYSLGGPLYQGRMNARRIR